MSDRNPYAEVTARILAELEAGTAPWVKPWSATPGQNMPCNAISNRPYSGCNVLLLWMARGAGFATPRFLTYKQAQAAGGNVRAGEKGHRVFFVKPYIAKGTDKVTGEETEQRGAIMKAYTVFNVAQCDGLPDSIITGPGIVVRNADQRHALCDEFLAHTGATIREGSGEAYFAPGHDYISLPAFAAFKSGANFYATAFHEITHWTGHKSRLDRNLSTRFGDNAYAAEELVAELGAAFLCAEFSIDGDIRHASYIAAWIKLLKSDPRAFFTAASKAQQAADYLRKLALADAPASDTSEAPIALAA